MRVLSVVGARPQFVKAAPVEEALAEVGAQRVLLHTGQHYDELMSEVFFEELDLPEPDVHLGVGSGPHGRQTAEMLAGIEDAIRERDPDAVLVYGDTNSTLAGALAAAKTDPLLAHVEAGLRSGNRAMPEEHNRVLADHASDLLFAPTGNAVDNLADEGLTEGVHRVGDPMHDAVLAFADLARERSAKLDELGLEPDGYHLATVHRPRNADRPERLAAILSALVDLDRPVVLPAHPRTGEQLERLEGKVDLDDPGLRVIEPVGYLDMLHMIENAHTVFTDSGGVQKEAYLLQTPCVTLREETEWVETVEAGWNRLAGADPARIEPVETVQGETGEAGALFGGGEASQRIADALETEIA